MLNKATMEPHHFPCCNENQAVDVTQSTKVEVEIKPGVGNAGHPGKREVYRDTPGIKENQPVTDSTKMN